MGEYFNQIFKFLWAVVNNWAGYATGGIVVALVWLWTTYFERPVSRKLGIALALIFLFFAFFTAWREQHNAAQSAEAEVKNKQKTIDDLSKPEFVFDVGQSFAYYKREPNITFVLIEAQIVNNGAPSVALNWSAHYKSSTLDKDIELVFPAVEPLVLPFGKDVAVHIYRSDLIQSKTVTPIARGGMSTGRILVAIPDDRTAELLSGAQITFGMTDYRGKEKYYAVFTGGKLSKDLGILTGEKIVARPH